MAEIMADVKEVEKLFLDGEFEKSFELLSELVKDERNGRALYLMGLFYLDGICVQPDDEAFLLYMDKAMASGEILPEMYVLESYTCETSKGDYQKWMKKMRSAKLDKDPFGMYQIGHCYEWGLGTKQDFAKALFWYEKAAKAGLATAACAAGGIYKSGRHKGEYYAKAFQYFSQAAEKGFHIAEGQLADCFFWGLGTVRDLKQAIAYTERAANHGNKEACGTAGLFYLTHESEKTSDEKAFSYFQKGAELGHSESCFLMGRCYNLGRGTDKDLEKAIECYERAWNYGFPPAANALGDVYRECADSPENFASAFFWFQKAAEYGELGGIVNLGECYKDGIGTEPDKEKAKAYLKEADERGELRAAYLLGEMAMEEKNYGEALRYLRRLAADKYTPAMNLLAMCYAKGFGVAQNLEMAEAYLKESEAEGDPDAKRLMKEYLGI